MTIFILIINTWFLVFGLITFVWFLYLFSKKTAIIDMFWSIAITVSALSYMRFSTNNHLVLLTQLILILWALRLSLFLFFTRILSKKHQDQRYDTIAAGWKIKKSLGFFINFQFQGSLAMVIALPFLFISQLSSQHHTLTLSVLAIIVLAILAETISDLQLFYFKKNNRSGVCNIGLWRYSRHPNYFFDWLTWLGFSVIASQVNLGWLAYISPLLLFYLMRFITIPITEQQSLRSRREQYQNYQQVTSIFIPKPTKPNQS